MDSRDVDQAVAEMVRVLSPHTTQDWQTRAGSLEWTCWKTAAHIAHDLLAYAGQVAARPITAYLSFDLTVSADATPQDVLGVVIACGGLLSSAIATAHPETRAWHHGPCNLSGFAAMGVAETLLHTYDITQGLEVPWVPPEHLSSAVLSRLMPDAPAGDPVQVLLWSHGRAELDGQPHIASWVWKVIEH